MSDHLTALVQQWRAVSRKLGVEDDGFGICAEELEAALAAERPSGEVMPSAGRSEYSNPAPATTAGVVTPPGSGLASPETVAITMDDGDIRAIGEGVAPRLYAEVEAWYLKEDSRTGATDMKLICLECWSPNGKHWPTCSKNIKRVPHE